MKCKECYGDGFDVSFDGYRLCLACKASGKTNFKLIARWWFKHVQYRVTDNNYCR